MNALVVHGGGPTAVLNASLAGLVHAARPHYQNLHASPFGFDGLLKHELTNLFATPDHHWDELAHAPGSLIGSSRRPYDLNAVAEALDHHKIDTLYLTGGNGTMRTALSLSRLGLNVIGIPKTIDNDLAVTHHSPGYASTAYFFACAARDIGMDNRALPSPLCVLETLGRNTGWITAATALARHHEDDAPHVILLPEQPRSLDQIATEVEGVYRRLGRCVIAVCEGQLDETGHPFGADLDRELASNLGHTLAKLLTKTLGVRARAERPGLLGRTCGTYTRDRDRNEAYLCGQTAAQTKPGHMVALDADGGTFPTSLESVAGIERQLPPGFLTNPHLFRHYAEALTGSIHAWPTL